LRHNPGRGLDSLNLRSITGFIYLPMVNTADPPRPLLVSEIQLIRMHKKVEIQKPKDVAQGDSLAADSLVLDTLPQQKGERLSPMQMRENQPRERKINVVKENPNPIHPNRGIPERKNRRRK
jgi:hypothetical protein